MVGQDWAVYADATKLIMSSYKFGPGAPSSAPSMILFDGGVPGLREAKRIHSAHNKAQKIEKGQGPHPVYLSVTGYTEWLALSKAAMSKQTQSVPDCVLPPILVSSTTTTPPLVQSDAWVFAHVTHKDKYNDLTGLRGPVQRAAECKITAYTTDQDHILMDLSPLLDGCTNGKAFVVAADDNDNVLAALHLAG